MPRVHTVKAARKARPSHGIKKGDTYYWWQFRKCPKSYSRTYPKQSQLTRSAFWGAVYSMQEGLEKPSFDTLEDFVEGVKTELQNIIDELEEKISNLESAFPNGCPSLETVQARKDSCDDVMSTLESIDVPKEDDIGEGNTHEDEDSAIEAIYQEVEEALGNISD